MSFFFKANILYCRQPQRMLRLLVDLFEATYLLKNDHFIVDLDGARFLLKELPKKEQLEMAREVVKNSTPQMSFCLTTTDRQLLSEIEERFQFFLFKESSDLNTRERISRIQDAESEGVLLFDDDGRSWSIVLQHNASLENSKELSSTEGSRASDLYDHYRQKLDGEEYL